jgi:hypothetical protein
MVDAALSAIRRRIAMIARSVSPFTFRGILDRVGLAPKQRLGSGGRSYLNGWQRMFAELGGCASVSNVARDSEILLRDGPERFYRFCPDCGDDTPHEGYDELGLGWYAQISGCRHCGRQGMRVWSLV